MLNPDSGKLLCDVQPDVWEVCKVCTFLSSVLNGHIDRACACARVRMGVHVSVCVRVCLCTCALFVCLCTCACVSVRVHVHVHVRVRVRVYASTSIRFQLITCLLFYAVSFPSR